MQFVKRFSRGGFGLVFKLALTGLIVLGPIVMVFGTAEQIKKSLAESAIYDKAVTAVIDNAAKDSANQPDSPFSQPAVQDAAKKALSPSFLQSTSEGILDGVYGWLQKKTPAPTFNIDVSPVKQQFVVAVGDYAVARAGTLPVCTPQQTRQMGSDIDPLTATCLPSGFDVESLRTQIAAELDKQTGQEENLLQQSTITPETLPKDENGMTPVQNITQDAEKAPEIFGWITRGPWLLGILVLLSGGLYVLLHDDKRRALRSLAITLLIIGGLALLSILASNYVFGRLEQSDSLASADVNLKQPITDLVQSLRGVINQKLLIFGGFYALLGAGALAGLHLTKPKTAHKSAEPTDKSDKPTVETEIKKEAEKPE